MNSWNDAGHRGRRGWAYDYMLSCPSLLIVGYPSWRGVGGIALLTLLYPRYTVLAGESGVRILGNIPSWFMGGIVAGICRAILEGKLPSEAPEDAYSHAMYMGGFNIYVNHNGRSINTVYELVNTEKLAFYYKPRGLSAPGRSSTGLDDWAMLAVSLRMGDMELLLEACRNIGRVQSNGCLIEAGGGELLITSRENSVSSAYQRVFIDNNGLRSVVKTE